MNIESQAGSDDTRVTPVLDYFAELGLPRVFAISKSDLEERYLERSKLVHPDRFVTAEAKERVAALSASMQLNEAYKALKSDRTRAEHLLALYGVAIGGNDKLDPSFLLEILEAREELAEALAAGNQAEVMRLEEGMLDRKDEALARVADLFAEVEDGQDAPLRLAEIKRELIVLRYVDRYLEAATDEID